MGTFPITTAKRPELLLERQERAITIFKLPLFLLLFFGSLIRPFCHRVVVIFVLCTDL